MPKEVTFDRNGLEILDEDECMRLLAGAAIGRVGIPTDAMPVVLPVAFALDDHRVVFCSTRGTKLYTTLDNAVVAFEADEVDSDCRSGWSVCVTGRVKVASGDAELARLGTLGLRPWADLHDAFYLVIEPDLVTGRRVHPRGGASDLAIHARTAD